MLTLSLLQCRVLGVMLEKETTTPEQYPLSLNGLMTGCNQKSNREPVLSLSEGDVQNTIEELVKMQQLMVDHRSSSRVPKYIHRFCNTEFGNLQFSPQQRAIICVLLLRGPQTPGELRSRTNRLAEFADVGEVETALTQLQDLNGQTLVKKLAREPGKRESRYVHLFTEFNEEEVAGFSNETSTVTNQNSTVLSERVTILEKQVAELTEKLAFLMELVE